MFLCICHYPTVVLMIYIDSNYFYILFFFSPLFLLVFLCILCNWLIFYSLANSIKFFLSTSLRGLSVIFVNRFIRFAVSIILYWILVDKYNWMLLFFFVGTILFLNRFWYLLIFLLFLPTIILILFPKLRYSYFWHPIW